jgi:xyloglucan-specific exo-beta-1,4-glucanase
VGANCTDRYCGAILDTWTGINGNSIFDLMSGTNFLTNVPNQSTRLTNLLEGPNNAGDSYGSQMKGWLVAPVSGNYTFWIASDDNGEFWLSTDSDPANKVRACYSPEWTGARYWTKYSEQKSNPISLVAGQAYYYEVRECVMFTTSNA